MAGASAWLGTPERATGRKFDTRFQRSPPQHWPIKISSTVPSHHPGRIIRDGTVLQRVLIDISVNGKDPLDMQTEALPLGRGHANLTSAIPHSPLCVVACRYVKQVSRKQPIQHSIRCDMTTLRTKESVEWRSEFRMSSAQEEAPLLPIQRSFPLTDISMSTLGVLYHLELFGPGVWRGTQWTNF